MTLSLLHFSYPFAAFSTSIYSVGFFVVGGRRLESNRWTSPLRIYKFYYNLFLDLIGRLVVERFDVLKNRKTLVISCCLRSIIVVLLLFTNVAAKTYFPIIPSGIHDVGYIGMKLS